MNPIPSDEWAYIDPLERADGQPVRTMLELGNKKNSLGVYKQYFEQGRGIRHTSVDWNGEDGALNLDLRKPLELGRFDMVTNIGTTEHVSDQAGVWENIHRAVDLGGILVSITPYPDGKSWWWHGEWYPTADFFWHLRGFEFEKCGTGREIPNQNLCVRMRKTADACFVMPPPQTIVRNQIRPR